LIFFNLFDGLFKSFDFWLIYRLALEEVKFLQKLRERKLGIPALSSTAQSSIGKVKPVEKTEAEGEKEELVLQDTFAQETAVLIEDPNM